MVVILTLMANRRNRDGVRPRDLEQRHISCRAKRSDQLSQQRTLGRLAACEWRTLQRRQSVLNCSNGVVGDGKVATTDAARLSLKQKVVQAQQIVFRLAGQPDPVRRFFFLLLLARSLAIARRALSFTITAPASI